MDLKVLKPRIGSILFSIVIVAIIHSLSDFYGCKPGPCLANTIHNNYLIYIIIFIVIYIIYNLVFRKN